MLGHTADQTHTGNASKTAQGYAAMDIVEVSPPHDHAEVTSLAAAAIALEYLCIRAWQAGARGTPVPE